MSNGMIFTLEEARLHHHSRRLADMLSEYLPKEKPVYDFGCGDGYTLGVLEKAGFTKTKGYEGTAGIEEVAFSKNIVRHDLTQLLPPCPAERRGSCISIEVMEHIPAGTGEHAALHNITQHCDDHLVLSWAVRGQGGQHHVNERDGQWVIPRVEGFGFKLLPAMSWAFRGDAAKDAGYFAKTIYVFRRAEKIF